MPDMPITPGTQSPAPVEQNIVKFGGRDGKIIVEIPKAVYDEQIKFLEKLFSDKRLKRAIPAIERGGMRKASKKIAKTRVFSAALKRALDKKPPDFFLKKLLALPSVREDFVSVVVIKAGNIRNQELLGMIINRAREINVGRAVLTQAGAKVVIKGLHPPSDGPGTDSFFTEKTPYCRDVIVQLRKRIAYAQGKLAEFRKNLLEPSKAEAQLAEARRLEAQESRIFMELTNTAEAARKIKSLKADQMQEIKDSLKTARPSDNQEETKRLETLLAEKEKEYAAAQEEYRKADYARSCASSDLNNAKFHTEECVRETAKINAAGKFGAELDAECARAQKSAREKKALDLQEKQARIETAKDRLGKCRTIIRGLQTGLNAVLAQEREPATSGRPAADTDYRERNDIERALTMQEAEEENALREFAQAQLDARVAAREAALAGIYAESLAENRSQLERWSEKRCAEELIAWLDDRKKEIAIKIEKTQEIVRRNSLALRHCIETLKEAKDILDQAESEARTASRRFDAAKERFDAANANAKSSESKKQTARRALEKALKARTAAEQKVKEALLEYERLQAKIENIKKGVGDSTVKFIKEKTEEIRSYWREIEQIDKDKLTVKNHIAAKGTKETSGEKTPQMKAQAAQAELDEAKRMQAEKTRIAEETARAATDLELEGRILDIKLKKAQAAERAALEKKAEVFRKTDASPQEKQDAAGAFEEAKSRRGQIESQIQDVSGKWGKAAAQARHAKMEADRARKITGEKENNLQEARRALPVETPAGVQETPSADSRNGTPARRTRTAGPGKRNGGRRPSGRRGGGRGTSRCEVRTPQRGITVTSRIDKNAGSPAGNSAKTKGAKTPEAIERARIKAQAADEAMFGGGKNRGAMGAGNRPGSPANTAGAKGRGRTGTTRVEAPKVDVKVEAPKAPRLEVPEVPRIPDIPRVK